MKCPHCGRAVPERGACTTCLPFNLYFTHAVTRVFDPEELRVLVKEKADEIRAIGCGQVRVPLEAVDPSTKVRVVVVPMKGWELHILPCIDTAGYESVMVGLRRPNEVTDGWHRVFSFN